MDLKMEVYTPELELVGMLEIQRSVILGKKAFSSGSFSVESLITNASLALLQPENIIWIEGETAGIIEYVQEEAGQNGPYIAVKGYTLTGILKRRILWGRYDLKGTVPQIMCHLVDDCCIHPTRGDMEARKIPGLVLINPPDGGEEIRIQKTGGELLEALEELGETYGVPFGIRFNPAVPQMEFWTRWGQNRSVHQTINDPVFYSTELDDVLSSEYTYNSQSYRNVALVAGEGEGKDRIYITVEGKSGNTPDVPAPDRPPAVVGKAVIGKSKIGRLRHNDLYAHKLERRRYNHRRPNEQTGTRRSRPAGGAPGKDGFSPRCRWRRLPGATASPSLTQTVRKSLTLWTE